MTQETLAEELHVFIAEEYKRLTGSELIPSKTVSPQDTYQPSDKRRNIIKGVPLTVLQAFDRPSEEFAKPMIILFQYPKGFNGGDFDDAIGIQIIGNEKEHLNNNAQYFHPDEIKKEEKEKLSDMMQNILGPCGLISHDPEVIKKEFKELCIANYIEITGQEPLASGQEGKIVSDEMFDRECLFVPADPNDPTKVLMRAFVDSGLEVIGLSTENFHDGVLGSSRMPLTYQVKNQIKGEMERKLKGLGLARPAIEA